MSDLQTLSALARQRVGTTVCEKYRLLRLLGVGGMAAVYAARHRNGHPVAIKILHGLISRNEAERSRFRREARLANRVGHRAVVPVMDDGMSESGEAFLILPLLKGETVRERWVRAGKALPAEMVAQIAYALLEVLAHAHAKGVVHLDIKPENLFITRDGELRVFDFGVGRLLEPHGADGTRIGRALGTPAFMPPEQALGRFRGVDPRADLWAVGATMWRLLTGRYVHDGGTASEQLLYAATRRAPRMVDVAPEVPTALADVIDRALEFDRERRWPSATEMREALAEAYAACFELDLDAGEMEPAPPTSRAADGLLDVRDLPTWQSESPTGVV